MKKTAPLLFAFIFFALSSCEKQQTSGRLNVSAVTLTTTAMASLSDMQSAAFTPPKRMRGNTRLNVMDYGAIGDGIHNDTKAIQAAIDALPADGGTVYIPQGVYLINGDFKDVNRKEVAGNCIRLRSNMHLELSPRATLKQRPTDAYAAYIIYAYHVNDVEISGGEIVGERNQHLTSTGENGRGIQLRGCERVTIRNIKLSDFWGDGISIGTTLAEDGPKIRSNDIVIDNIISTNNRRQGLSIGPATNVQVWNSEFSETEGTAPQCGIDIEPEQGQFTDNVLIQNCVLRNNHAYGILLYKRLSNIAIKHCKIFENNAGIVCEAPINTYVAFNDVHNNTNNALVIKATVDGITAGHNRFYENNGHPSRPSALSITGVSSETARDIFIRPEASNVVINTNVYK